MIGSSRALKRNKGITSRKALLTLLGGGGGDSGTLLYYNEFINATTVLLSLATPEIDTFSVSWSHDFLHCGPEGYAYYLNTAAGQALFDHGALSQDMTYEGEYWTNITTKYTWLFWRSEQHNTTCWQIRVQSGNVTLMEDNSTSRQSQSYTINPSTNFIIKVQQVGNDAYTFIDDNALFGGTPWTTTVKGNRAGIGTQPNSGNTRCNWYKMTGY